MKRSKVLLASKSEQKLGEFRRSFSMYGIVVERIPPLPEPFTGLDPWSLTVSESQPADLSLDEAQAEALEALYQEYKGATVMAEASFLCDFGTQQPSAQRDLSAVDHWSFLFVWWRRKGEWSGRCYADRNTGYIDRSRASDSGEVFGWDDIFVPRGLDRSAFELKQRGAKTSSRDLVVSQYLMDRRYYRKAKTLKTKEQALPRVVDFEHDVEDFLLGDSIIHNPVAEELGLVNVFRHVLNSGLFFRSARNRRQYNYWWPGLNAGVPFVRKKDSIHERTFLVHDLCHQLIPDLVFTGAHSPEGRKLYVIARMISEGVSLVMADMFFVESLRLSGHEYDYKKRRIHPVFASLNIDVKTAPLLDSLQSLCEANVEFAVQGLDDGWKALLPEGESVLAPFKEKYEPFFVEDLKWTANNYQYMLENAQFFKDWWRCVEPIRSANGLDILTIEEFLDMVPSLEPVEVFRSIFERWIVPAFEAVDIDSEAGRQRAFCKYMMGQMALFFRYQISESKIYCQKLVDRLQPCQLDLEGMASVRSFYDQFVDILWQRKLLTSDDRATFKGVFPLLAPGFAFYDEDEDFYEPLSKLYRDFVESE